MGEAALAQMRTAGLTEERMQQGRAGVVASAERAGRRGERSRAAFAAAAPELPAAGAMPHVEDWMLLCSGHFRTLSSYENGERHLLRFVRAQVAVMNIRGLDVDHLLRPAVVDGEETLKVRSSGLRA